MKLSRRCKVTEKTEVKSAEATHDFKGLRDFFFLIPQSYTVTVSSNGEKKKKKTFYFIFHFALGRCG